MSAPATASGDPTAAGLGLPTVPPSADSQTASVLPPADGGERAAASLPTSLRTRQDCRQGAVRAARLSADGQFCLTCGADKTLKLWNPYRGALLKTYTGHGHEVLDAAGSCDNGRLVSCSQDKSVVLWEVTTGKVLNKWRQHAAAVTCVRFNEDSSVAVSGSVDGTARAWDCRSRQQAPVQTLQDATDSVTSLAVSDTLIVTGSADGRVRCYDLRAGALTTDTVSGEAVSCVSLSRDGQCVLAGCMEAAVRLLDLSSGQLLAEFSGHRNSRYPLNSCLDVGDAHVLSGSEQGCVFCWEVVSGREAARLQHPGVGVVHSLAFHPTRPALLTAAAQYFFMWEADADDAQ